MAKRNSTTQAVLLSTAQMSVLSAAAARPDGALVRPARLRGNAATALAGSLTTRALVREVASKLGVPVWRQEATTGKSMALVLTKIGRAAVADTLGLVPVALVVKPPTVGSGSDGIAEPAVDATVQSGGSTVDVAALNPPASPGPTLPQPLIHPVPPILHGDAPRPSTKLAAVVVLLSRDAGATIDELMAATGWLPHTTRAALTGLRKRGYGLCREPRDGAGSAYRVTAADPDVAAAVT